MTITQTSFHTSYRSWFSLSLLSSGLTEEVAALVFWLYKRTVLCFVLFFFFKRSRKLRLFSLLVYATDSFIAKRPVEFLYLFKISQISAIFGSDFATTAII